MSYRADDRDRCVRCDTPVTPGEVFFSHAGDGLCRPCSSLATIAETRARLQADHHEPRIERPRSRARAVAAYLLLAPIAAVGPWSAVAAIDFWLSPRSCSELACIDLLLVPLLGLVVGGPCALTAVFVARHERRPTVAIIAAVATAWCIACIAAP